VHVKKEAPREVRAALEKQQEQQNGGKAPEMTRAGIWGRKGCSLPTSFSSLLRTPSYPDRGQSTGNLQILEVSFCFYYNHICSLGLSWDSSRRVLTCEQFTSKANDTQKTWAGSLLHTFEHAVVSSKKAFNLHSTNFNSTEIQIRGHSS
jgi:hypothetical protein